MSPADLLYNLAMFQLPETVFHPRCSPRPGQELLKLSPAVREQLARLRSDDVVNLRVDAVFLGEAKP